MFGPWLSAFAWLRGRLPKSMSALKPNANFITLHCEFRGMWSVRTGADRSVRLLHHHVDVTRLGDNIWQRPLGLH